jgi:hypothetical protein
VQIEVVELQVQVVSDFRAASQEQQHTMQVVAAEVHQVVDLLVQEEMVEVVQEAQLQELQTQVVEAVDRAPTARELQADQEL